MALPSLPHPRSNDWRLATTTKDFYNIYCVPEEAWKEDQEWTTDEPLDRQIQSFTNNFLRWINHFEEIAGLDSGIDTSVYADRPNEEVQNFRVFLYTRLIAEAKDPRCRRRHVPVYLKVLREYAPLKEDGSFHATTKTRAIQRTFHKAEQISDAGSASEVVWDIICRSYREYDKGTFMGPYTSIVGSSGIGKSFVVQSMARSGKTYVVYVSFAASFSDAYPERSLFADWLSPQTNSKTENERAQLTVTYESFIAGCIRLVQYCRRSGISPLQFYEMQVRKTPEHMKIMRGIKRSMTRLEDNAQFSAHQTPAKLPNSDQSSEVFLHSSDRGRDFRSGEDELGFDYGHYIEYHLADYQKQIDSVFHEMKIPATPCPEPQKGQPEVLFCFDEASVLLMNEGTLFYSLRRALRHQFHHQDGKIFAVFLDTSAKYNVFVPPTGSDPSAKAPAQPRRNFRPIFEIPTFDIMAPQPLETNKIVSGISQQDLLSFGRPCWAALIQESRVDHAVDLVERKLYGGDTSKILSVNVLTSMISWRIPINVLWHYMGEHLVAHHMRLIWDVNDERTILSTKQPSEPILALVARKEMVAMKAKVPMLMNLFNQCNQGSIDSGDIGELVACLILLFAVDKAGPFSSNYSIKPIEPMGLADFMDSLYGKATIQQKANHRKGLWCDKLKKIWKSGYVFFNHFDRLQGDLDQTVLQKAWRRGCALIAYPGTAHYDLAIPVAIPGQDMTCILVQVKNRKHDVLGSALKRDAKSITHLAAESLEKNGIDCSFLVYMALWTKGDAEVEFDIDHAPERTDTRTATRTLRRRPSLFHNLMSTVSTIRRKKRPADVMESEASTDQDMEVEMESLASTDQQRLTEAYVIVACGLDERLYPSLADNDAGSKEVASILKKLLDLKSEGRYEGFDSYQKSLTPVNNARR